MAYCTNCGKEISDEANVCIHCGVFTEVTQAPCETKTDGGMLFGVIGLYLSFIFPIATFVISGIGYGQSKRANNKMAKAVNLIALILSTLIVAAYIAFYFFYIYRFRRY